MILMDNGENIYPQNIEQRILEKNDNIQTVRVYLDDKVLKATIYLKEEDSKLTERIAGEDRRKKSREVRTP